MKPRPGLRQRNRPRELLEDAVTEIRQRLVVAVDPADGFGQSESEETQALGGASDREIMRQGRWTNPRTVHRYIRTANPLEDTAVTRLGL